MHVAMVVFSDLRYDYRVYREVRALQSAGHQVSLVASAFAPRALEGWDGAELPVAETAFGYAPQQGHLSALKAVRFGPPRSGILAFLPLRRGLAMSRSLSGAQSFPPVNGTRFRTHFMKKNHIFSPSLSHILRHVSAGFIPRPASSISPLCFSADARHQRSHIPY